MISFKVSVLIGQPVELKTKLKVESDTIQPGLPFENLLVETVPANQEIPNFQIRISNSLKPQLSENHNNNPSTSQIKKKTWWQRFPWYNHSNT